MFALRIKLLRKEKGISQKDLSAALHVAQTTVSQWESGGKTPGIDTLMQVADYFRVSTDYLLGRTDEKSIRIIKAPPELESAGVEEVAVSGRDALTATEIQAVRRLLERNKG